ncbi:MAG TPA: 30S ribosomal protein S9, partial [Candidatus Deferrimicrobium sp.]
YSTGRRKRAVARVWMMPGTGKIAINRRESPQEPLPDPRGPFPREGILPGPVVPGMEFHLVPACLDLPAKAGKGGGDHRGGKERAVHRGPEAVQAGGVRAELAGEKLTVWWAIPLRAEAGSMLSPGTIRVSGGPSYAMAGGCVAPVSGPGRVVVETGDGWLQLEEIEWETRTAKGEAIIDLLAGAANGRLS